MNFGKKNKNTLQGSSDLRLGILADYFEAQTNNGPKATRLFEAFLRMMEGGYWSPGDRIPSELELTGILPVGLATVQSALRKLSAEGLIVRKRKTGSFVADSSNVGRDLFFYRFLTAGSDKHLPLTETELSIEKVNSRGEWSEFLGNHDSYIRIDRVLNIDNEFHMLSRLYLADEKFNVLLDIPLSELMNLTFRVVLQDRFGVTFTKLDRRVAFTQITLEQSKTLGCEYGMPAMLDDIRQYTLRDKPLFFMRTIIPKNDKYLQVAMDLPGKT